MLRSFSRLLLMLLTASTLATAAHAEETWTEVRSPHCRVVSNGSAADARKVAAAFEQMRSVLQWRFPGFHVDLDAPLTIYAVRDYGTVLRLVGPTQVVSNVAAEWFIPNWERNVALVQLDTWDKTSHDRLFSGYTHEMMTGNLRHIPEWLDTGMSQMIGFTQFKPDQVLLGPPSPGWKDLKSEKLLPIADLMSAYPASGRDPSDYAQRKLLHDESWALVHFLTLSPGMDSGAKLLDFLRRMETANDDRDAFRSVFGDPALLDAPFAAYVKRASLMAIAAPALPAVDPTTFSAHSLSAAEQMTEEALFRLEAGGLEQARSLLQNAEQLDGQLSAPHEELGILAYERGDLEKARQEWHTAVSLDPNRYVSAFALSLTGTPYHEQTPEQLNASLEELRRILRSNPRFAPAYTQVALVQWWLGNLEGALRASREAERLTPRRFGYHLLTARILLASGEPSEAAALVRRAAMNAVSIDQASAVDLWQSIPSAERDAGPPLTALLPQGLATAYGTVERLTCGDARSRTPARVVLRIPGATPVKTLDLTAGDHARFGFEDSVWIGGGHNMICQASQGRPVRVLYRPGTQGYGELFRLNLAQEVPPAKTAHAATESVSIK